MFMHSSVSIEDPGNGYPMMNHIDAFVSEECSTLDQYSSCHRTYRLYKDTWRSLEFSLTVPHMYAVEIAEKCEDMGMRITGYVAKSNPYTTGDFCVVNVYMLNDETRENAICVMSLLPSGDMRCACPGTIRSEGIFLSSHYIDMVAIRAAALVSTGHELPWDYRR